MSKTYVIGVGMTKFDKPGTKEGDYHEWAAEAGRNALDPPNARPVSCA